MNAPLKTPLPHSVKPRFSPTALLPSVETLGNLCKASIAPLLGLLAFIGFWSLLAQYSEGLPGPLSTWQAALVLFADPFYDNGPNDMGIGWNILNSLGRVGVGFGLAALGLQLLGVHACQNLARADEVAFVDQDLADSSRRLGGDVDLDGLDAAVAACEPRWQCVGVAVLPIVIAAAREQDGERGDNATGCKVHLFITPCGGAHC